jgi:hypothetical protein
VDPLGGMKPKGGKGQPVPAPPDQGVIDFLQGLN